MAAGAKLEALLTDAEAHRQHVEHMALGYGEAGYHSVETVQVHLLQDSCPHVKAGDRLVHGSVRLGQARKLGWVEVGADFGLTSGGILVIELIGSREEGGFKEDLLEFIFCEESCPGAKRGLSAEEKGKKNPRNEKRDKEERNKKSDDFACTHHLPINSSQLPIITSSFSQVTFVDNILIYKIKTRSAASSCVMGLCGKILQLRINMSQ